MSLMTLRDRRTDVPFQDFAGNTSMTRFRDEMDRLIDRMFNDAFIDNTRFTPEFGAWLPTMDVKETEKELVLYFEVPGVDPKDVNVQITGNMLSISGKKEELDEVKEGEFRHTERRFGSFRRAIDLPDYVDVDHIKAEHKNGTLTIKLPKLAKTVTKKIAVKPTN